MNILSLSFGLRRASDIIDGRLTYDATLAELTSLEEMMRYMMDDGQIHSDVISKLWQVYSESSGAHSTMGFHKISRLGQTAAKAAKKRSNHHSRYASTGTTQCGDRSSRYSPQSGFGAIREGESLSCSYIVGRHLTA